MDTFEIINFDDMTSGEIIAQIPVILNWYGIYTKISDSLHGKMIRGIMLDCTQEKAISMKKKVNQIIAQTKTEEVQDNTYIDVAYFTMDYEKSKSILQLTIVINS